MPKHPEIERVTEKVINQYFNMFIKLDYCFTPKDLFSERQLKNFGISQKQLEQSGYNAKRALCAAIIAYLMRLIILDIIENNVTFEFPLLANRKASIYVKCFYGEKFSELYAKGAFSGIDFLASGFKGYHLYMSWWRRNTFREKPIYIGGSLKQKFLDNINNGKQYY